MSTESTSHAAAIRGLLLRLHFYAGVLIAPFLLLTAVTGLLYAASFQIEDFLYEDYRTVEEDGERLRLSEQVRAAAEAHPDRTVTAVRPAAEPDAATGVVMDDGVEREAGTEPIVFVDPHTGAVTGDLTTYGSSQALPVRAWASGLHRHLHLGEPGRVYSELAASWLWVVVLGGIVLWAGRRRRPARLLWPRRAGGRSGTLAWHGPVGLWLAAVLLFLSATGLTWSRFAGDHIAELRAQLDWQTPTLSSVEEDTDHAAGAIRHRDMSGDIAVLDEVADAARGAGLEDPLELTLPVGGAFTVAETSRSHPVGQDRVLVRVDAGGASVTEELRFEDWPFMARATNVLIAAHMGLLFGLPNQLVLAAAMIALIALIGWGYRMWWQRRPRHAVVGRPYPRGGLRRLPWPPVAFAAPVVAAVGWFVPLLGASLVGFLILDVLIGLRRRRRPGPQQAEPSEGDARRAASGLVKAPPT